MKKIRAFISSLFRPFRNWRRQRFFRRKYGKINKDVVIFSNNCLGGITYHDANKEFLSPTINLIIENEFLTFVKHFSVYSKRALMQIESPYNYPRGILKGNGYLPDILIGFVHYDTFEQAKIDWEKRCKRFSPEYPVCVIYCTDDLSLEETKIIESLNCQKLIVICYESKIHFFDDRKIKIFKVPLKYQNMDYSSYKHLLGRTRFFDDFAEVFKAVYFD